MASANNIDLSGLMRFKKTLKQMASNTNGEAKKSKLEQISNVAYNVLKIKYSSTDFVVEKELSNNKCTIYAKGEDIAFDEFGTGVEAEGTYNGKKPEMSLVFESAGYMQSTNGWVYYYDWIGPDNRNPKRTLKDGTKGWFTTSPKVDKKGKRVAFCKGEPASNRFYDAVVEIKEKIKEESK